MYIMWKIHQTIKDTKNSIETQTQNQKCQGKKWDAFGKRLWRGKRKYCISEILPLKAKRQTKEGVDLPINRKENLLKNNNAVHLKAFVVTASLKLHFGSQRTGLGNLRISNC